MSTEKFLFRRIIAGLIDYAVILSITSLYIFYFGELNHEGEYSVNGIKAVPIFLFWFFYLCVVEVTLESTLGNYLVSIQPVDKATEKRVNLKQSFLRHIVDPVDMFFFGLMAIIIINSSKESVRLGDLLAKTKVIKIK